MEVIKWINKITVPTLNLTESTKPYEVIAFIRELDKYRKYGSIFHEQLLTKALQGDIGKAWCISTNYNYEAVRKRLIERMQDSSE